MVIDLDCFAGASISELHYFPLFLCSGVIISVGNAFGRVRGHAGPVRSTANNVVGIISLLTAVAFANLFINHIKLIAAAQVFAPVIGTGSSWY